MRPLRFFFLPLAVLLVHCLTPASHTDDDCDLGTPASCHGDAIRNCRVMPEEEESLQNRWIDDPCGGASTCVDTNGSYPAYPHCVERRCTIDGDCAGKGICRDRECVAYWEPDKACGTDPQLCKPGTVCTPLPPIGSSAMRDGGALVPCTGGECICVAQ